MIRWLYSLVFSGAHGMQHFSTHTRIPQKSPFGTTTEGLFTDVYTLTNARNFKAKVSNYGATLTELHVPNAAGKVDNVVLGFSVLKYYDHPLCPHFGGTIGRYANRIARGEFVLNGALHTLTKNDKEKQTLHGGTKGFDRQVWDAELVDSKEGPCVRFKRVSPDQEEGFPGNLTVSVTYTLLIDALKIDYEARCDQYTHINLTNHSYFNLAGAGQGDILDHELLITADCFTPVDENLIPLGEVRSVKGTPLDFTSMRRIGERMTEIGGYDHNYVFKQVAGLGQGSTSKPLRSVARLRDPKSNRRMEVITTEPAMQLYTGNGLDGKITGLGGKYVRWGGVCLETQHYPDSPHQPKFPNTVLKPGEVFTSTTIYKFS